MSVLAGQVVHYKVSPDDAPKLLYNGASILPAVVVRVWSDTCVNLQIFTDGPTGTFWKTSVLEGDEPGKWTSYWQPVTG